MGTNNILPNFNASSMPNNPLNGNNNIINGNLHGHGIGPDSVNINVENNFGMNKGPNMNGNPNQNMNMNMNGMNGVPNLMN
jgi:hypothetical protein